MKRITLSLLFSLTLFTGALAQIVQTDSAPSEQPVAERTVKYGYLSYDSLLHAMPEYAEAMKQWDGLRQKYEAEAAYNESSFKRQFAEFLEGQKDFPQNILQKRQRDLQLAMERGIEFRRQADSLLTQAKEDLLRPARRRLAETIARVGMERGYDYVVNTDANTFPFLHPAIAENAAPFVAEQLGLAARSEE